MGQTKNEKDNDKPFAQNIQGFDLNKLLEDPNAFEMAFFPPESMNYNPNNHYVNQCIDFNELNQLLNEGNSGHDQVVTNGGCDGSIMQQPVQLQVNNAQVMEADPRVQENIKQSGRGRRKYKQYCPDAAHIRKIKNREAARRSHDQKKAYMQQLESEVQGLRKQNANLWKFIQFSTSASSSGKDQKNLRRTASGAV
ncbi:hypothetical protein CCACVL1_22189 [Corchorus capsularis]|uniref:BZIP domain-containing protein n=1 Tax=Corchorus capsularis TaxID=210143 RepID=A0A1R3H0N5_COCAP|nr:hypothetical protein CCACVL1_22189 [Corchorus capsularis]